MLIGVVGKPSAGKSTFFKAATLLDVAIANYPFTTIKPNHAVGFVRIPCVDSFFKVQCNPRTGACIGHQRFVPVDLLDVAGLVPDAHKGEGLGLQFLSDLNQADALIHVVDISGSTDSTGKAVAPGSHDPLKDIAFLERELDYWFLDILKRGWGRFVLQAAQTKQEPHKAIAKQLSGLRVDEDLAKRAILDCGLEPKPLKEWSEDDLLGLATWLRKRTKPMLIAANKVDVPGAAANFERLRKAHPELLVIPCSAEAELALREAERKKLISYLPGDADFQPTGALSDSQKKALDFIRANVLRAFGGSGIQAALNAAVFTLLKYKAIYPGGMSKLADSEGRVLPDCFLMPPEATALDFAFRLHTDFGKNFIKAMDVKRRMPVGKEHILKDSDVIEIMAGR